MTAEQRTARNRAFGAAIFLGRQIFIRDFKVRYRRALLGFGWALVPTILLAGGAILIAREFGVSGLVEPTPYPVWLLIGLVAWGSFADGVALPQQMYRRSRSFLRRTPVPWIAIMVAVLCNLALNLALKSILVVGVLSWYGVVPAASAPFFVVPLTLLIGAGLSIGLVLAPFSLVYLDIRYAVPFILLAIFLITPVVYPVPTDGTLSAINMANPLTYLLTSVREFLLHGVGATSSSLAALTPAVFVLLWCGAWFHARMTPRGIAHI